MFLKPVAKCCSEIQGDIDKLKIEDAEYTCETKTEEILQYVMNWTPVTRVT